MTGRQLRKHIDALGLSQPQFAALIGIDFRTVNRYARGALPIPRPVAILTELLATVRKDPGLWAELQNSLSHLGPIPTA